MMIFVAISTLVGCTSAFNVSNTLGDTMVLQRAPQQAVVWGQGDVGVTVTTTFQGKTLSTKIASDGVVSDVQLLRSCEQQDSSSALSASLSRRYMCGCGTAGAPTSNMQFFL